PKKPNWFRAALTSAGAAFLAALKNPAAYASDAGRRRPRAALRPNTLKPILPRRKGRFPPVTSASDAGSMATSDGAHMRADRCRAWAMHATFVIAAARMRPVHPVGRSSRVLSLKYRILRCGPRSRDGSRHDDEYPEWPASGNSTDRWAVVE